jgi:hypothetical protein
MQATSRSIWWGSAWLALILTALPPSLANVQAIKKRTTVEASDHPEVVVISARNSKTKETSRYSGVLIAPHAVLTAAHGVEGFDAWEVVAPYVRHGTGRATAKLARAHPQFKLNKPDHDLAVLILNHGIDIGRNCPTLHDGDLYPIETRLIVVGRVDNGNVSSTQLYKAQTTVVPFPGNTNVYGGHPQVVEEGDSGGPVFLANKEREIVGVVSGYLGLTRSNVRTDVYIPITSKNRPWILRQL